MNYKFDIFVYLELRGIGIVEASPPRMVRLYSSCLQCGVGDIHEKPGSVRIWTSISIPVPAPFVTVIMSGFSALSGSTV